MKDIKKIVFTLLVLIPFIMVSQEKKIVMPEDFGKWAVFKSAKLSNDGNWFAYIKSNESDILYIQSVADKSIQKFECVKQYEFSELYPKCWLKTSAGFEKIDLTNHEKTLFPKKEQFFFAPDQKNIIWVNNDTLYHETAGVITGVTDFFKHPSGHWAVIYSCTEGVLKKVKLTDFSSEVITSIEGKKISDLFFDEGSDSFVYAELKGDKTILTAVYQENSIWKKRNQFLDIPLSLQWDKQKIFVKNKRVYLYLVDELFVSDTNSKNFIYFNTKVANREKSKSKYYCWDLVQGRLNPLFNDLQQEYIVTGLEGIAVIYDSTPYDTRDYNGIVYADFYMLDENGVKQLIVKKIPLLHNHFAVIPNSGFVVFYKDGFWYSYDMKSNKQICLNKDFPDQFYNTKQRYISDQQHFGILGIKENLEDFLVYDEFDVWQLSLKGRAPLRLTNGRIKNIIYRDGYQEGYKSDVVKNIIFRINLITDDDIPFVVTNPVNADTKVVLLCNFKEEVGLTDWQPARVINIKRIASDKYFIQQQSIENHSYSFIVNTHQKKLWDFDLNEQLDNYYWPKSLMVNSKSDDDSLLRAGLIYPANWDKDKTYPMVVYIYETVAHWKNKYWLPTFLNADGFNATILSQEGYFVLLPDLRYKRNDLGIFLIQDLESLINQATNVEKSINIDKLGLIGHSFGGYEVMYIVGQTNLFKGAVAGAGVSDLYDLYYEDANKGSLGYFTVENSQFRTDPPYSNKKFDLYNPIKFVNKIQTPMLIWTGENDYRIRKEHSKKIYLALWRQKKDAELIIYKNENHVLSKPENQKDLTIRIVNFYNKILKNP